VAVATRLPVALERSGGWQDTSLALPAGQFEDALTGRSYTGEVALSELLSTYPVALLLASS
jgi:(1->4)-alpha-D-glucan 1-alpha-D-glucosylmutase